MVIDDKTKDSLRSAFKEMSGSMVRVEAEKDFQKDVIERLHDEFGIDKKILRKVATVYHKANMDEVRGESAQVEDLYEDVFHT
jgi:glucose-6-phosphate-specific signal transduction histidine kinase